MHMNPAKTILDLIGVPKAAEVTGKHVSRIYRWTKPASRGGTGGVVPHADALKLLAYCHEASIPLTPADFMQEPSVVSEQEEGGSAPVSAAATGEH